MIVGLCLCLLLISFSDGQQQREWTQRDCQEMARACDTLPKGAQGSLGEGGPPGRRGPAGTRGRPGQQGPRGFSSLPPGPPGATAPRGERGNRGYPGLRGEPGKVGPDGLKGQKGYADLPDTKGQKGLPGSRGATGGKGLPGESVSGWTKCVWTMDSDPGDGLLKECEFTKKQARTSLHVVYEGSLQIGLCRRCCKRWYFTFNDAECTQPSIIDGLMSGGFGNDYPHHAYSRIEGICEDSLQPGLVRIALRLENCRGFPGAIERVDANIYNQEGRILIREISPSQ